MQGRPVCLTKAGYGPYRMIYFGVSWPPALEPGFMGLIGELGGDQSLQSPHTHLRVSVQHGKNLWVQLGQSSTCKDYQ